MSFDAEMLAALETFTIESLELRQDMEECLLGVENEENPSNHINAIFRAAHTIKGSAGLFGLDHIVDFTHVVESVLDSLRDGKLSLTSDLIATLLPCSDHMALLIRDVIDGQFAANPALTTAGLQLLEELQPYLNTAPHTAIAAQSESSQRVETMGGGEMANGDWHLSLRFGPDSFRDGMDPLAFISYLETLGEIVHLTTISSGMPSAGQMDPETSYLGFEIDLKSAACKQEIESVFEFVRDASTIHILPMESGIDAFISLIKDLPEDDSYLGQLLVHSGVITRRELEEALNQQESSQKTIHGGGAVDPAQLIGEILVEQHLVQQPVVNAALEKQKQNKDKKSSENQSIRVDAERLDKLIDLVGELVITGAGVNLRSMLSRDNTLKELSGEAMRLIEEVRDSALQLRMVPIGTTFSRFQRVVRDIGKELGKEIELVISGGDTEVDKSVVEKIGDPLMHLVRNSMDHGIEHAPLRLERGKPAKGTLRLNAYHASSSIVIEVSDDGGGLNRDRILEKATERGLIAPGKMLSDQEIYALIFEPGFSTAQQVSNLSGRGVGMDVVKSNVTALRGSIEVDSQAGLGATIRIYLPLTLAIIDGFMVGVGESTFVIPLDRILECVALPKNVNTREYMDLRGQVLPLIRLGCLLNIDSKPSRRENVVVVEHAGNKAGIIVDRLLGEFQTVIKPLGKLFAHTKGIAGSTILGTGKIALILDVSALISLIDRKSATLPKNLSHQFN
jgi:two-component system chemotaxis sensor kinase CheA